MAARQRMVLLTVSGLVVGVVLGLLLGNLLAGVFIGIALGVGLSAYEYSRGVSRHPRD